MFRLVVLVAYFALCHSHAVPVVAPIQHAAVVAPVVVGYAGHGYGGYGYGGLGYGGLSHAGLGHSGLGNGGLGSVGGHGYAGHGLLVKTVGHHILKRSPHFVAPLAHVAHVAPVAVSHQSRLDVRSSPTVVATSAVQPVVAPVLHTAPLLHKPFVAAPLHFGGGFGGLRGAIATDHYGHGFGYH